MITIIDSGICNLGSVIRAMEYLGIPSNIATNAESTASAEALVLPGVGSFPAGMEALHKHGLVEPIRSHVLAGKPLLGICLGMQLLANGSDEFGKHKGLGLISGWVKRLPDIPEFRIPNIGWCEVQNLGGSKLFAGLGNKPTFYFVHSYAMECDDVTNIMGSIRFGEHDITVACRRGNVFGAQFHPEKSQDAGLAFLANFATLVGSS